MQRNPSNIDKFIAKKPPAGPAVIFISLHTYTHTHKDTPHQVAQYRQYSGVMGEADSYYTNAGFGAAGQSRQPQEQQLYPPPQQYGQPSQQPQYDNSNQYAMNNNNNQYANTNQYAPNTNGQQPSAPPYQPTDGKGSFDETFKVEKPKYNDLWAGILVCRLPTLHPSPLSLLCHLTTTAVHRYGSRLCRPLRHRSAWLRHCIALPHGFVHHLRFHIHALNQHNHPLCHLPRHRARL